MEEQGLNKVENLLHLKKLQEVDPADAEQEYAHMKGAPSEQLERGKVVDHAARKLCVVVENLV